MGVVQLVWDRLTNVMSGMGTTADRRAAAFYSFNALDGQQAEAGYRSSWLVRKIVDVPPLDMTRAWRDWQTDAPNIEKLEKEERRLQLKAKCQRALILARLYGGSALILGTNDADPSQPLNPKATKLGGLTYVHVLSRWQLSHGDQRLDPADPWFGHPVDYSISANQSRNDVKIHPSRVVPFIGQKAPEGGFFPSFSWFWGDPIMQSIGDAVRNADLAQSGFSSLIDRAAVDVIKLKDLMSIVGTSEGEKKIATRLAAFSQGKSNWRAAVLDTEDEWQQLQVNWSGIPAVMDSFLLIVAGAADIPMTRLLGQSPKGLQSTGDGEERDYLAMIQARQDELLKPALDRVDELLIPSALGTSPSDIYYSFAPLQEENEKDGAAMELQYAQALTQRVQTGIMPESALAAIEKNRMVESGRYPGAEAAFEDAEAAGDDPLDPANQQNEADVPPIEQAPPQHNGGSRTSDSPFFDKGGGWQTEPRLPKSVPGAGEWTKGQGGIAGEAKTLVGVATGVENLTDDETAALSVYKNGNYKKINAPLRKGLEPDAKTASMIKAMDAALARQSLSKSQTVYRSMVSREVSAKALSDPASLKGMVIEDRAFMSTSLNAGSAANMNTGKSGAVLLTLKAKSGAKALAIDALGSTRLNTHREQEILFARGSRVRIDKVSSKTWHGHVVIEGTIL